MKVETIKVGALETNCYLIIKKNKCLIVDPGEEENKIVSKIEKLGLIPLAILITHYHFDHIGALKQLEKKYNIPIYDYSNYIDDDKIIKIGNFRFKIINTKGHKEDLVTFYFFNEQVMFVGDFIFKNNIGRCDLPGGNFEEMINSINKIKIYPNKTVIYPGHGDKTTLGYELTNNEYLKR